DTNPPESAALNAPPSPPRAAQTPNARPLPPASQLRAANSPAPPPPSPPTTTHCQDSPPPAPPTPQTPADCTSTHWLQRTTPNPPPPAPPPRASAQGQPPADHHSAENSAAAAPLARCTLPPLPRESPQNRLADNPGTAHRACPHTPDTPPAPAPHAAQKSPA